MHLAHGLRFSLLNLFGGFDPNGCLLPRRCFVKACSKLATQTKLVRKEYDEKGRSEN